jgi:diguanylate cyclase (GGDEF)-like protein
MNLRAIIIIIIILSLLVLFASALGSHFSYLPLVSSTQDVIIILLLIMTISVVILYKKASDEITARKNLEDKLREASITDELTGIYNRKGFFELAGHQFYSATRNNNFMTLYYLDIDDLKYINNRYGHIEGDNALKDMAEILTTTFRKSDILARIGGDEFAVLMVRSTDYKSENITNRLENTINDNNRTGERPFKFSVSIGEVAYDPEIEMNFDDFIKAADSLLHEQKNKKEDG